MQRRASQGEGQKKSPLSWWCLFGQVCIEEVILRTDKIHQMRPFAESAGVSGRCKSRLLQRAMVDFGCEHSFASASKRFKEHYGFELDASAFRDETLRHGARAERILRTQYAQPFRNLPSKTPATIIAEADGSMLCTVEAGLARKGPRPRHWLEIRLLAAQKQGSTETIFAATFGSVQEAGLRWGHVAKQAGRALESSIHVVCDGAEWLRIQAREIFGDDGRFLTDYFHVCEYLAAAAPSIRPEAPEQWRETQQKRLKRGASAQVIKELAAHVEPASTPEDQAPARAAHRYLSNRPETLDYASAIAADLPIGSGLIESGHKHVLQRRLKNPRHSLGPVQRRSHRTTAHPPRQRPVG